MAPGSATHSLPFPGRLRALVAVDTRSLAALRIGLGLLLLANLALRAPFFEPLYGMPGVLPPDLVGRVNAGWYQVFFPYLVADGALARASVALVSGGFAVTLVLGLFSRTSTALSWFLLASLNTRNPLATSYEDAVLTVLLFWGIFLPLGERFSLDARRRERPPRREVVSGASAAILVQFAAIYFFTALHKTGAAWHADANAVWYTLSQLYAARPTSAWLGEHGALLAFLTRLTWHWELLVPLLFFSPVWNGPLRSLAVASVWVFHLGLGLTMALALFPPVMMVGAAVFLPGWFWERLPGRGPAASGSPLPRSQLARGLEDALPLALLALVLLVNVSGLPGMSFPAGPWRAAAATLKLNQSWKMYSPEPQKFDYFYVMPGRLADASWVDVAREGRPLRWEPPARSPWRHPVRPWALHLDRARAYTQLDLGLPLAAWICRRWNEQHDAGKRLVALAWVMERFDLAHERSHRRDRLGSWRCAGEPGSWTREAPLELGP